MKAWKIATIATIAIVAATLLTASALAYMGAPGFYTPYGTNTNTYPGGMMGGTAYPQTTVPTAPPSYQAPPPTYPSQGWGRGCWGWNGYAAPAPTYAVEPTQITISQATTIAQTYLVQLNNPNLAVGEVEEYTQNFYVQVYERDTGTGAFELLINKYTGVVSPEMGPNMMWNTKYGVRNGVCGWFLGNAITATTVTTDQATVNAQQFLDAYYLGTTVGDVTAFYGHYHVEVLQNGKTYGMLSVNAYTGQVWYHNWHGAFIQ